MKALSLTQPWASLVARGTKLIENRKWRTIAMVGQRFAIHASGKLDRPAIDTILELDPDLYGWEGLSHPERLPYKAIIGMATLDRVITSADDAEPNQRHWFFGPYGFVLRDVVEIAPIPANGILNFWEVPTHMAERVPPCFR